MLPPIFVIELNRFHFINEVSVKYTTQCTIEASLDLGSLLCDSASWYDLFAIVIHVGKTNVTGHYYTYLRSNTNATWYRFDDLNMQQVEAPVCTQEAVFQDGDNNACLLVYMCRQDLRHLVELEPWSISGVQGVAGLE